HKIPVFDATAKLKGKGAVALTGKDGKPMPDLTAKHIIIATGARARTFPGMEPDGKTIWTYREALLPDIMPKSLLVIGSGAIGIELASFFNTMGAQTTVVEVLDRILPVEDEEVSKFARRSFEKQGMKIHTGAKVESLKPGKDGVEAKLSLAGGKSETL